MANGINATDSNSNTRNLSASQVVPINLHPPASATTLNPLSRDGTAETTFLN